MLCMHNGCQQYYKTSDQEEVDNSELRLKIYQNLRHTIITMFKDSKDEVQHNINLGKSKAKDSIKGLSKANATPTASYLNSSAMSKNKSANDDTSEILIEDNDADMLKTYHKFFISRKQAIIDAWKKERFQSKSNKLKDKQKIDIQGKLRLAKI